MLKSQLQEKTLLLVLDEILWMAGAALSKTYQDDAGTVLQAETSGQPLYF